MAAGGVAEELLDDAALADVALGEHAAESAPATARPDDQAKLTDVVGPPAQALDSDVAGDPGLVGIDPAQLTLNQSGDPGTVAQILANQGEVPFGE